MKEHGPMMLNFDTIEMLKGALGNYRMWDVDICLLQT
jgi:hypothetical protein